MCTHNNNNNKTSNMSYKKRLASSSDEFVTLFQASILFRDVSSDSDGRGKRAQSPCYSKTKLYLCQSLTPVNPQIRPDRAVPQ